MKKLKNMTYNRFNINIISQSIFLATTPLLFFWTITKGHMIFTSITLIFVWISQIIYLIYYLNKVNRDLAKFLLAFKYQDSTMVFKARSKDSSFRKLYMSFNDILSAFGKIKLEKEKNLIFFQNTIEHIGIGLIAFNSDGKILISNKAFKKLFNLFNVKNIDSLNRVKPDFPKLLKTIKPGHQELIKLLIDNKIVQLSIRSTDFKLDNEYIRLISFQDIKTEIEQGEMEAWQKLIRILTHEIMNSVSPITLLSSSLINLFEKEGKQLHTNELENNTISDSIVGLKAIKKRSRGLAKFVEDYRNITQLPTPNFKTFSIKNLLINIEVLFKEEINRKNIKLSLNCIPKDLQLTADEKLIEQVIINLIKNSTHAVENIKGPQINIDAFQSKKETIITIEDNGKGISKDQLENIFVPFFTTKKDGSGIGLSLSRQIMRLHNGAISVTPKKKEKGVIFALKF